MWLLLLVTLVDGGAGHTKFDQHLYYTQAQCVAAQHRAESATVFGYCTYKEPKP